VQLSKSATTCNVKYLSLIKIFQLPNRCKDFSEAGTPHPTKKNSPGAP
jgi:hypothetical protein